MSTVLICAIWLVICNHFERKHEADDWAADTERKIKRGEFKFDQHNQLHTFKELVTRFLNDGAIEHHRSADDTRRHLTFGTERLGNYALSTLLQNSLVKNVSI